jgi:protein YIPF1/2
LRQTRYLSIYLPFAFSTVFTAKSFYSA